MGLTLSRAKAMQIRRGTYPIVSAIIPALNGRHVMSRDSHFFARQIANVSRRDIEAGLASNSRERIERSGKL